MVFYSLLNILIIYGGRNDKMTGPNLSNSCFKDIFILRLENLIWIEVTKTTGIDRHRCSHVAGIIGTKMIIFGGMDFKSYASPDISLLELESDTANVLHRDEEYIKIPTSNRNNTKEKLKSIVTVAAKYSNMLTFLPIPTRQELYSGEVFSLAPIEVSPILYLRKKKY